MEKLSLFFWILGVFTATCSHPCEFDGWRAEGWRADGWLLDGWRPDGWRPDSWHPDGWRPDGWRPEGWRPHGWRAAGVRTVGVRTVGVRLGGVRIVGVWAIGFGDWPGFHMYSLNTYVRFTSIDNEGPNENENENDVVCFQLWSPCNFMMHVVSSTNACIFVVFLVQSGGGA